MTCVAVFFVVGIARVNLEYRSVITMTCWFPIFERGSELRCLLQPSPTLSMVEALVVDVSFAARVIFRAGFASVYSCVCVASQMELVKLSH